MFLPLFYFAMFLLTLKWYIFRLLLLFLLDFIFYLFIYLFFNQIFSPFFENLIVMNESIVVYITIIVILECVGCPEKGMLSELKI